MGVYKIDPPGLFENAKVLDVAIREEGESPVHWRASTTPHSQAA